MVTWLQLPEFDGLDLTESYVLGWSADGDELRFELEAVLVPGHPRYSTPPPSNWACYRRATLVFPSVTLVRGLAAVEDVRYSTDATGERDYGNVDHLETVDGGYRICGDFGDVIVESGQARIEFRE